LSGNGGEHFGVFRETPGCFLGIGQSAVHGYLKHPAITAAQGYLGIRVSLDEQIARRTGAWLVASHAAVFDFDLHGGDLPIAPYWR